MTQTRVSDVTSHSGTPETVTGVQGTASRIQRWSTQVRNAQSSVSGTGTTPTECWDATREANARSICFRVTDSGTPESGEIVIGVRDRSLTGSGMVYQKWPDRVSQVNCRVGVIVRIQ